MSHDGTMCPLVAAMETNVIVEHAEIADSSQRARLQKLAAWGNQEANAVVHYPWAQELVLPGPVIASQVLDGLAQRRDAMCCSRRGPLVEVHSNDINLHITGLFEQHLQALRGPIKSFGELIIQVSRTDSKRLEPSIWCSKDNLRKQVAPEFMKHIRLALSPDAVEAEDRKLVLFVAVLDRCLDS